MSDQGHWTGVPVDPRKHFGFVYLITDVDTGQAYIGRKQVWMAKPGAKGCRSRVPDRSSPKWKPECWKESDWRTYSGSSKSLQKHIKDNPGHTYEHRVLKTVASKGALTYWECSYQWKHDVMAARMDCGNYRYFNGQIGGIKYRPKL